MAVYGMMSGLYHFSDATSLWLALLSVFMSLAKLVDCIFYLDLKTNNPINMYKGYQSRSWISAGGGGGEQERDILRRGERRGEICLPRYQSIWFRRMENKPKYILELGIQTFQWEMFDTNKCEVAILIKALRFLFWSIKFKCKHSSASKINCSK